MASSFKALTSNDKTVSRVTLNEAIPLTASLFSGTYDSQNIRPAISGMYESWYDYPYLSSSANHIVDVTVGYSALSDNSSSNSVQNAKKINMYNQLAASLVGYDASGQIQEFDVDGNILAGGTKHRTVFFLLFSRLLVKDGIKRGSFNLQVATSSLATNSPDMQFAPLITDTGAETDYRTNSPAGEYGILYKQDAGQQAVGLIYYQAGIAVVTASIFSGAFGRSNHPDTSSFEQMIRQQEITGCTDGLNNYFDFCNFLNTTELNSTIYFARLAHNEFNYSANPTFVSASKIVTKTNPDDPNKVYVTGIGLYSATNELLAVAKLSEPVVKSDDNELTLRVRTDW